MSRPPLPPFDEVSARQKVQMAEDAWNTRLPAKVSLAYTADSQWRNRAECFNGHEQIVAFLTRKWDREHEYRLIKELWAYHDNKIAVRFAYEYHDENEHWYRAYGNENWEFASDGLMQKRIASINDMPISNDERLFLWPQGPRPEGYPGLSMLNL